MPIKLTKEAMRAIFPRAPQVVLDAFAAKQDVLTKAGINATRNRLAFFFANIEHECGGFTIPNLTENINYTAARMAQVWPNRFNKGRDAKGNLIPDPSKVVAKYGQAPGWQKRAFDDIYGGRMGNRAGTSDGSTYIGRGGPQWTGRGGYEALQRLTGLPVVETPSVASQLDRQPEICAAFWTWKGLNRLADANDFLGCVTAWNGGANGLADRKELMAGNDPVIAKLETVAAISAAVPQEKAPANKSEQALTVVGATAGAGGAAAAAQQGISALHILAWIGGLSVLVIAAFLIIYRITKGHWPWSSISTGKASLEPLPLTPQRSAASLELASVQLELPSAASPVTPSPPSSKPTRRRKPSAKPSPKTLTRRASSSSSKPSAGRKSSPKRKSKSKS